MVISKKKSKQLIAKPSKAILNTIKRQTAKILTLLSGAVGKYEFSTGKVILPEKSIVKKAATIKKFEYLPADSELKKQTSIAEKQYNYYKFDKNEYKTIEKETSVGKIYNRSNLMYDSKQRSYEYSIIKNLNNFYPKSKQPNLASFYNDLDKFNNLNPRKGRTKEKKE